MDWIETYNGYVKKSAIVEVHLSSWTPGIVWLMLKNGEGVKYRDFGPDGENSARVAMEELMDFLTGNQVTIHDIP